MTFYVSQVDFSKLLQDLNTIREKGKISRACLPLPIRDGLIGQFSTQQLLDLEKAGWEISSYVESKPEDSQYYIWFLRTIKQDKKQNYSPGDFTPMSNKDFFKLLENLEEAYENKIEVFRWEMPGKIYLTNDQVGKLSIWDWIPISSLIVTEPLYEGNRFIDYQTSTLYKFKCTIKQKS